MIDLRQETDALASWPMGERLRALHRLIPRAQVEAVLAQTGHDRAVCPRLPGGFRVWLILALGLCCRDCSRQLFRGLPPVRPGAVPGRSTLCEARPRVGIAPRRLLAAQVICLLGQPRTPGACYRGRRTMAWDGLVLDLADPPAQARALGRPGSGRTPGACPQVRLVARCETGRQGRWRLRLTPLRHGALSRAPGRLRFLQPDRRLWWDRTCLNAAPLAAGSQRRAHLLARRRSNRLFAPLESVPDGALLSKRYRPRAERRRDRNGIRVRILEYTLDDPTRPGAGERQRLLTTRLDAELDPATTLGSLYHARWEQELSFDDLKTPQRERPGRRRQTPAGGVQAVYGLLRAHSRVRGLRPAAAATEDRAPRRLSFPATLTIRRCRLPECPASQRGCRRRYRRLVQALAAERLEPRRNRINPRVIQRKMSHGPKKRPLQRFSPQPTKPFAPAIVRGH